MLIIPRDNFINYLYPGSCPFHFKESVWIRFFIPNVRVNCDIINRIPYQREIYR